ncbi:MAG: hypothetical protein ACKVX9_13550 [Blastocatellia bacterium]
MELNKTLFGLLAVWDELPALLGANWPAIFSRVESLLERMWETSDPNERALLAADILIALRSYPNARQRLNRAISSAGTEQRGARRGRPVSPPKDAPSLPTPAELATALRDRLDGARARYANVCLTEGAARAVAPGGKQLRAGQDYELRFDIGPLSAASVVTNAEQNAFPSHLLPRSEEGQWLEVVAASDDFTIPRRRHSLFLPASGPSWVCGCRPGGAHTCDGGARADHLFIPITAPTEAGSARLRLAVYYANNLVQSQLLTAEVSEAPGASGGYSSSIDYTLTANLRDVRFLPERTLHILTNCNPGDTRRILINGDMPDAPHFNLNDGQIGGAVSAAREALRNIHFEEFGGQLGAKRQRRTLLNNNNAKPKADFVSDLARLARLGWQLYTSLLQGQYEWWEKLRDPATVQVSRVSGSLFVFPWALVYDLPLESEGAHTPCPMLNKWEEMKSLADSGIRQCPQAASHASKNVLCPFGFWGYRHLFEQPPSMPRGRALPLDIRAANQPPVLAAGLSLKLDNTLTTRHLSSLRQQLSRFNVTENDSLEEIKAALARAVEVVYFYCHGRQEVLKGSNQAVPYLDVGDGQRIEPSDLDAWRLADWPQDHWRETSPLVFINGCHTVEFSPETLMTFVDRFVNVYAAGVIGTEITMEQPVASEAAEVFFQCLQEPQMTVGRALQRMRLHFLSKGNLLGLAYTPYCSADLKLAT